MKKTKTKIQITNITSTIKMFHNVGRSMDFHSTIIPTFLKLLFIMELSKMAKRKNPEKIDFRKG